MSNRENLEENLQDTHREKVSSRVGVNLRASAYLHQGDRKYMEDEYLVAYQKTWDQKDIQYAFFGIFDGHGGKEAANFARDHLMDNIVSLRSFWSDNDDDVLGAIKEGFVQTHLAMWEMLDKWPRTASGWPSTSGTTASIAFIKRQKIYIGHVGDSGIALGFEDDDGEWLGEFLTTDHKPESADEKARINECGGKVVSKSGVPRIVWNRPKSGHLGPIRRSTPMDEIPFLAVARSLGDLWSYNANNNQFVVSPEPDVCVIDIDVSRHRCLIFGTDGLWNVLSPTAAVNIAYYTEKNNEMHFIGTHLATQKKHLWISPSQSIVKTGALERYRRLNLRADNTSALTVFLDPPGLPKREVLLRQMGLKKATVKSRETEPPPPASVKVHVYNINPLGDSDDRAGMFCIKERVPEEWQNKTDSLGSPTPGLSSPLESSSNNSDMYSLSQSASSKDSFIGDNRLRNNKEVDSAAKCSECGCANRTDNIIPKTDGLARDAKSINLPKRDDIQIPVVSSSTAASHSKVAPTKMANEKSKSRLPPFRELAKRRTRSCVSLSSSKNENQQHSLWKQVLTPSTKPSSSRHRSVDDPSLDSSNRVLRSLNGTPNISHSPLNAKMTSNKRKRTKETLVDEPISKSLRVLTRSHTWNHTSIITRSQEKTKKGKPR